MKNIDLSVVVIGKNESLGLERLVRSIEKFKEYLSVEFLYVDSASTDDSVAVANIFFDKVIVLAADHNLSASAGRFVGTRHSKGKWVLFLDGDMQVESNILNEIAKWITHGAVECVGLVGSYLHHYPDGTTSIWQPKRISKGAEHFGGAVLLRKDVVNECNWNPRIFSNEEIDLYSRMQEKGYFVTVIDGIFIHHYTEKLSLVTKLKGNFLPNGSYLGKKYFGFGQLISSRIIDGNIFSLIRAMPEQFIFNAVFLACLFGLIVGEVRSALICAFIAFSVIALRRSFKAPFSYLALIPQTIFGFSKYEKNWSPKITEIYENNKN